MPLPGSAESDDHVTPESGPRGCPRCACDVRGEEGIYWCIGLDAESAATRNAVNAYYEEYEGKTPRKVRLPSQYDIERLKKPAVPIPACGWWGKEEFLGVQSWRRIRRKRGQPRKK